MASMQPAAQLQFQNLMSPSGPCLPQPTPIHQEKVAKLCPQTRNDSYLSKELVVLPCREAPCLQAVVESQAFKNILVDEMDMMVSRAATVIQANWKGYRLRQKLISQMTAAKAIQEAWRRFSTRRLMHSNKLTAKQAKREEDRDIPYHQPQQVRFCAPEDQSPLMVTKETQFPSFDNLVPSRAMAGPCASRVPRGGPQPQSVIDRLTGPCMLTNTFQSSCLMKHLERDSVEIRHVGSKTINVGTLEPAATGRCAQAIQESLKTHTQTETDAPKAPLYIHPVNRTPTKVCPVAAAAPKFPAAMSTAPKSAPQTHPSSPAPVMKMQAATSPASPMTRPPAPVRPNSSLSNTTPQMQVRPMVSGGRAQPPGSAVTSPIKACPRLGAPVTKVPLQTGPRFTMTKTSLQMRPMARSQAQTSTASTSSKTSQSSPMAKPSPQTRLAAMLTKTPAQLRSVAAVLRTLCRGTTEVVASSPKCSSQSPGAAGNAPFQVHLNSAKAKVIVSAKQTPAVKVASQSCLAEGKGRCAPHGNLAAIVPKPPAKSPLEVEKMTPCPTRAPKKEAALKTNTGVTTRALSWTKVKETESKTLTQIEQRAEIVRVHSRVYMPEEMTVTLTQAQLAVPLTKTSRAQPSSCHTRTRQASHFCRAVSQTCTASKLARGTAEGWRPPVGLSGSLSSSPLAAHLTSLTAQLQSIGEQARSVSRDYLTTSCPASLQARSSGMTLVPPEVYPHTYSPTSAPQHHSASFLTKNSSQLRPPAEHVKTMDTQPSRVACQVCPSKRLSKAPSLAQLISCLAKVPSQAQLATETAKCLLAAHPTTDLSSKTQSQTFLRTSKASVQLWQHLGTLSTGPCTKPDDRSVAQSQLHSHVPNKTMPNPRSVATETQGMLVPLMTPSGHPVCNAESWGDSGRARTPPPSPIPNQAVSCHEDLAASIASLCADLVATLGSPEDLRTLLVKTLSQGEVRTALSQALSREVLGPSVVKALPQGMLGMTLMKALSWGELGISLSRALSRGELRPELSKASQGKLAEVLCKALTEDERATLSQALCQGELGAVFTQSLAQMAQRTGAFLPKAASKTVGSRMTTAPAPVEVTGSGSLSVAWGPALGPVGAQCRKVREGLPWEQPDGILWEKRVGVTLEGSPCSPQRPIGCFSEGVLSSTYCCPLLKTPTLSGGVGSVLYSGQYLRSLDLDSMACGEGPHVPKRPSQPPPPGPWKPLVANGVGPSSNQPSVTSTSPCQPSVASRVPCPGSSSRDGNVVAKRHSGRMGDGKSPTSPWPSRTCQGNMCQCSTLGVHRKSPCVYCSSPVRSRRAAPKEACRQSPPSGHRRVLPPSGNKDMVTIVRNVVDEQPCSDQPSPGILNPKLQKVSSRPTPKQEKHPQESLNPFQSRATGHHKSLLDELLAKIPQHPQIVLAKSYPRAQCQESYNSQSSLQSSPSASPSVQSSLPPSEILVCGKEGDRQDSRPMLKEIREVRYRLQGQVERTCPSGLQCMLPKFQCPPQEFGPLLSSTSLASNIQWDSDSGSDYSTGDLTEDLSQDTPEPWQKKDQIHSKDRKPNEVTCLDSVLPQDILAHVGAPSPAQAHKASEGSQHLSKPLEARGLCPSSSQPAGSRGVSPSLAQPSTGTGETPSLAHLSAATRVSPTLAQPPMDTGVFPGLTEQLIYYGSTQSPLSSCCSSMVTQGSGQSDSVQTPVATGVFPSFFQPFPSYNVPSHFTSPYMATVVTPNYVQPCASHSMSPSPDQAFMVSVRSPTLAHVSVANRASPNHNQPTIASTVVPGVLKMPLPNRVPPNSNSSFLAPRMYPDLSNVPAAALGALSLLPPTVVCGVGRGVSTPAFSPQQHTQDSSAMQSQPSMPNEGGPQPCVKSALGQPSLGVYSGPGGNLLIGARSQPSPQNATAHPEPTQANKGPSSPVAQTMHGLGHPSMASVEDNGLAGGTSGSCQPLFRSIAPGMSQGPLTTGLFLSLDQGANPPPMADAWASPAGVHWTQNQATMASGMGQSPCQAMIPRMQVPSELFPDQLGTGIPQPCATLPIALDPQLFSMATMVPPSYQYVGMVIADTAGAGGGALPQGSVDGKVSSAPVPKPVAESKTPILPQVSVIRGVGKSVPSESTEDGVAPKVPPKLMVDVSVQSVPPESMVDGVTQKVPPESMVDVSVQSVPPESMVDGVTQNVLPESMVDVSVQSVSPEFMVDGVTQNVPPESMVDVLVQRVPPESMVKGLAQRVPPESMVDSVAQKVPPESMVKGLAQKVPPESTVKGLTQRVPPESTVKGLTQRVPPESTVKGLPQRVPPESTVKGLTQRVPPESTVKGLTQRVPPESTVKGLPQRVPPESTVKGLTQRVPPESTVKGLTQRVPPESTVKGLTQRVPPESTVKGLPQRVPPESTVKGLTQRVPPESMVEGLTQRVPPESMVDGVTQNVPPESTVGVRTQDPLTKSVITGEDQSPHKDAGASDEALSLPPCPVASSKAPSHPQEIDGNREKLSPAVKASLSSHFPNSQPSVVASSRTSSLGSMLVGISPRPFQATQHREASQVPFLVPSGTSLANTHSPEAQKLAEDPPHLPTVLSSASKISQDPGLTTHSGVNDLTLPKPGQMADTESSAVAPSTDSVKPEGREAEAKLRASRTGLGATGEDGHGHKPLAAENVLKDQIVSKALLDKEFPGQVNSVTPVPKQVPSLGKHPTASSFVVQPLASESSSHPPSLHPTPRVPSLQEAPVDKLSQLLASRVSLEPQLSTGRAGTAELPLGLKEAKPGNARAAQSSEGTDSSPPPKNGVSSASKIEEPQSHTRSSHQESLTAKKSHQSIQGSFVSELLEGSMDRLLPFSHPFKPVPQVPLYSHKEPSGTSMVGITPIIYVGDEKSQNVSTGVQRVSLVHDPSSNGSQRPLLDEAVQDARQAGQPKTVLSLTTHLDQRPPSVPDPRVSYDSGSLAPNMPHGQNVEYINSPVTGSDGRSGIPTVPHSQSHQHVPVSKTSSDEASQKITTTFCGHGFQYITVQETSLNGSSQAPRPTPHSHRPHLVTYPKTGHNTISPPPTVPQGPVDVGLATSQSWNSKVPNVSVRATAHAGAPQDIWHPSRGHKPWEPSGAEAALDHKPSAELLMSVQTVEKVVFQAVVTIQACARGYLVRRTVRVWHQWATVIQATWRGYRVRRNLERLFRATTIIQAAWRGYYIRRTRAHHVLLPPAWSEHSGRAQGNADGRNSSEHRCFLSCQPDVCSVCQSLGPPVKSPPSVVMLVGSQPRTCHVCGHTLSTRVVQGFGQGISSQPVSRWASATQQSALSQRHRACTIIQAAWKGYRTRQQLRQQQSAAKMVQAMWRGHYTRSCLTTDALLGTGGPWSVSRNTSCHTSRAYSLQWPGV